jgi:hypothetical protein
VNGIEDRFRDAAGTDMPPSRLSADAVYAAAFRRRRRRVAAYTAAGLVVALLVAVVGVDVLRSSGDNRVAVDPTTEEETQPWLRDGALVTAVATDARHVYAVTSVCRPNESCTYRLLGSDDAGATWTVRQENFGGMNRAVSAPAAGVLYRFVSEPNPDYVDADPTSPKMLVWERISTDGGRTWTDLSRVTTPVDAVPAGGWLECQERTDGPCEKLLAYDPATARVAPLRTKPGIQVLRIGEVPSAGGFWLTGWDTARKRSVLATTPDRGRTWVTHPADVDVVAPVTADGVTGYEIVSDSYPVTPTGPNPTVSPTESTKRVYRTADGGRTWQRVESERPPPDGALHIAQAYVAADGTHVVLMDRDSYSQPHPERFQQFASSDDGRTYRPGGVTGLPERLSRESRTGTIVGTRVAGVYLAHDDASVFVSTDGLTWTGHPVRP